MQKLESVEGGLRQVVLRDQTKAAVERLLDHALFLENVGERPIRQDVDQTIALANRIGDPWPHEDRIGDVRFILVARVVLTPNNWKLGKRRFRYLIVNLVNGTADHLRARNLLACAEDILRRVISIDMRG